MKKNPKNNFLRSIDKDHVLDYSQRVVFILSFLCIAAGLLFTFNRGLSLNDEGYILQAASRVLHNEVIYKDFYVTYTPGSIYLTAFAFLLFGESVLAGRILALIVAIATIFVIVKICQMVTGKRGSIVSILVPLVYVTWGPMHINFSWPVMYCILFGLLTCLFLLFVQATPSRKLFVLIGLTTFLTIFFKQNFGAAIIITVGVAYLFGRSFHSKQFLLYSFLGFSLPVFGWFIVTLSTDSLSAVIHNFVIYFFQKIVVEGVDATPFIFRDALVPMVGRTVFYLSPVLVSVPALYFAYKQKKEYIHLVVFCLAFYLLGIRPVTDYVHLVPLLSLIWLPLLVMYSSVKQKVIRFGIVISLLVLAAMGLYTGLFKGYYRWETPLVNDTVFLNDKKAQVFVDGTSGNKIPSLVHAIREYSKQGDYLYINYYAFTVYFLADRKDPTKLIYAASDSINRNDQLEAIHSLQIHHVGIVLTKGDYRRDNSLLQKYINTFFLPKERIGDYTVWIAKTNN